MAEFDVFCEKHGEVLGASFIPRGKSISLEVATCESCLDEAKEEGLVEGREEGEALGFEKRRRAEG